MEMKIESKSTREADESQAAAWLLRRSNPQWSDVDQAELDQWLSASSGHRVSFIRLEAIWTDADRLKSVGAGLPKGQVPQRGEIDQSPFFTLKRAEAQNECARALKTPEPDTSVRSIVRESRRRRAVFAIAATILMVFVVVLVRNGDLLGLRRSYATEVGGLSTVEIADGSVVTLNTNSAIEVRFTEQERRIRLKRGEAYFEVAKDHVRPFAVYANGRRVVAVGTKFSVWLNSEDIRVAVTEGRVRLEQSSPTKKEKTRLFEAGTIARVRKHQLSVQQRSIPQVEQALSWRTGYIVLDRTPLRQAVAEFNRHNSRQLVIQDVALETVEIEGNLRSNNLDGFVRLLEEGFQIRADENAGRIVLRRK